MSTHSSNAAGAIPHNMVTTAFDLPGYRLTRNLGLVRGLIVRSRSIVGTLGASLQTLVGGNITLYTELCEKARSDAYELMGDDVLGGLPAYEPFTKAREAKRITLKIYANTAASTTTREESAPARRAPPWPRCRGRRRSPRPKPRRRAAPR